VIDIRTTNGNSRPEPAIETLAYSYIGFQSSSLSLIIGGVVGLTYRFSGKYFASYVAKFSKRTELVRELLSTPEKRSMIMRALYISAGSMAALTGNDRYEYLSSLAPVCIHSDTGLKNINYIGSASHGLIFYDNVTADHVYIVGDAEVSVCEDS